MSFLEAYLQVARTMYTKLKDEESLVMRDKEKEKLN